MTHPCVYYYAIYPAILDGDRPHVIHSTNMQLRDKYVLDSTTSYYSDPLCVGEVTCKNDEDDELVGIFPKYPPNSFIAIEAGLYNEFLYETFGDFIESFYVSQSKYAVELQLMLRFTRISNLVPRFLNKILFYTVIIYLTDYYLTISEIPNLHKITEIFRSEIPDYKIDDSSMDLIDYEQLFYSANQSGLFLIPGYSNRESSMLINDWDSYLGGDTDEN